MVRKYTKRTKRARPKRIRPEKIISVEQFLNPELRQTKEDLPRDMMVYIRRVNAENPKHKSRSEPKVDCTTKKYLGSGKRPRWMDCSEELLKEILAELREIKGILSDWYSHYLTAKRRGD